MGRFTTLCLMGLLSTCFIPVQAGDPPNQHHVMWSTEKGARKCITKKTREKAERAAALLRKVASFSDIQVAAGKCPRN